MQDVSVATIRSYEPVDEIACRACVVELQDAERGIDPRLRTGDFIADDYLAQMHARCRNHTGAIFVAEYCNEIVGLVMVLARVHFELLDEPSGDYALVAELVVRDGFRRRGIGRALLYCAEQYASDAGAAELQIGVLSENTAARDLYLHEGFAPYKETLSKPLRRIPVDP